MRRHSEPSDTELDPDLLPDPMDHLCGRCGKPVWFHLKAAVWAGDFFVGGGMGASDYHPIIAATYQCPGCRHASLFEFQYYYVFHEQHVSLLGSFPVATAMSWDDLPDDLRQDHQEAHSCFLAGQYRGATLVARGVLQKAVRLLTESRGSLVQELDALVAAGAITHQLRRAADEVRITGNEAAHPEELQSVSELDASDSLAFLDDFLRTAIVLPRLQAARAAKRTGTDEHA